MGWQRITDRNKLRRAETTIGADLAALWQYHADQPDPAGRAVHTRAFATTDGRHGYVYTDGHVDWDGRQQPPWDSLARRQP